MLEIGCLELSRRITDNKGETAMIGLQVGLLVAILAEGALALLLLITLLRHQVRHATRLLEGEHSLSDAYEVLAENVLDQLDELPGEYDQVLILKYRLRLALDNGRQPPGDSLHAICRDAIQAVYVRLQRPGLEGLSENQAWERIQSLRADLRNIENFGSMRKAD